SAAHAQSSQTAGNCTPDGWNFPARCMPLQTGSWWYQSYDLPFGGPGSIQGHFDSLAAFLSVVRATFPSDSHWSPTTVSDATIYETDTFIGVEYRKYRIFTITINQWTGNPPAVPVHCEPINPTGRSLDFRDTGCPIGWSIVSIGGKGGCACDSVN